MATTEDKLTQNPVEPPRDQQQPATHSEIHRSWLYRWGLTVARHRRAVLGGYLLVICLCLGAYPTLQKALGPPSYVVRHSDSSRVEQLLETRFPGLGSEGDALVFNSSQHLASDPVFRKVIVTVDRTLRLQKGVRTVIGPYDSEAVGQITPDEHTAISAISLGGTPDQRFNGTRAVQDAAARAAGANGVSVWLTGNSPIAKDTSEVQKADAKRAQTIALPLALVILLLAMGALVAALVPLFFALAGLILGDGVLTLLTIFFHFDSLLLAIMTMIGLGIGIDYALFIVSRFREELARSEPQAREEERVSHAVGVALATSGRTIIFSGLIVAFALASLFIVDSRFLQDIAIGAVVVVMCMLATAMTLLPAALSLLGPRVNRGALPKRLQPQDARSDAEGSRIGGWGRWALLMMRHPISAMVVAIAVLLLAALPMLHLRYGIDLSVLKNTNTISGKGEKVLSQKLSPGAVAPIEVVVTGTGTGPQRPRVNDAAAKRVTEELESDWRILGVGERRSKAGVLLIVVPSVAVDSLSATALVERIRKKIAPPIRAHGGPAVLVGGVTAQVVDLSNELSSKFPLILALILIPSLLLLLAAFRSVVLPIKAVLMNLLATGATLGIAVLVFQDGHGRHLLHFSRMGFIQISVPQVMFVLLFGLSMDYEVFLIRRMQEEWRRTGDNRLAVAMGMQHTARPITAAAAIMVAVFGSFTAAYLLELKELGFVLALAIALDATLIRFVLVPAVMSLFGAWNWWVPNWLARVLPDVRGNDRGAS